MNMQCALLHICICTTSEVAQVGSAAGTPAAPVQNQGAENETGSEPVG